MTHQALSIVDYTEKSIAVFGDTKPYKEHMTSAGGLFNAKLTLGDKKVPGWVFSKKMRPQVEELVNSINEGEIKAEAVSSVSSYPKVEVSKRDFMALVSRVENLEQQLTLLMKYVDIKENNGSEPVKPGKTKSSSSNGKREISFEDDMANDMGDDFEENDMEDEAQPRLMHNKVLYNPVQ